MEGVILLNASTVLAFVNFNASRDLRFVNLVTGTVGASLATSTTPVISTANTSVALFASNTSAYIYNSGAETLATTAYTSTLQTLVGTVSGPEVVGVVWIDNTNTYHWSTVNSTLDGLVDHVLGALPAPTGEYAVLDTTLYYCTTGFGVYRNDSGTWIEVQAAVTGAAITAFTPGPNLNTVYIVNNNKAQMYIFNTRTYVDLLSFNAEMISSIGCEPGYGAVFGNNVLGTLQDTTVTNQQYRVTADPTPTPTPTTVPTKAPENRSTGLQTWAKVLMGVLIPLVVIAAIVVGVVLYKRRKKK